MATNPGETPEKRCGEAALTYRNLQAPTKWGHMTVGQGLSFSGKTRSRMGRSVGPERDNGCGTHLHKPACKNCETK